MPPKVNRILNIGAVARVLLTALNGAGATLEPQFFEVELSPQRLLLELNLAAGLPVRLVSSRLCIFERGARS